METTYRLIFISPEMTLMEDDAHGNLECQYGKLMIKTEIKLRKIILIICCYFLLSCSEKANLHPSGLSQEQILNGNYYVMVESSEGVYNNVAFTKSLAACNAFASDHIYALIHNGLEAVEYKCCYITEQSDCAFEFR